ncbi:hypothetical protein P3H15_39660 [Rhodococcus sp. T2V]|uniref:hypothetical protein n=1 Tax=Rhodococcus sp. T2V TaxID=3034164 RepID=UPI0023E28086|nr:hypothetical protein [Rhodococcus sp. T2V]MDF3311119.1 hypothetical protein [Rhodococcus sp. T2V]
MTDSSADTARVSVWTLLWLAIGIVVTMFAVSTAFSVYGRLAVRAAVDDLSPSSCCPRSRRWPS